MRRERSIGRSWWPALAVMALASILAAAAFDAPPDGAAAPAAPAASAPSAAKDRGCLSCHVGAADMHPTARGLACVDCHGGGTNPDALRPADAKEGSREYEAAKELAHVAPRDPGAWYQAGRSKSANPERTYTKLLRESPEFVRFVNPGDLRVAATTCGPCHAEQVDAVRKSTMTTSAIFWAAAPYANGVLPTKHALFGESYGRDGEAQKIVSNPTPEQQAKGALKELLPLPRWEVIQPGEYFRAFEKGGIFNTPTAPEIGNPNPLDEAGRPDIRVSNRGRGTGLRISPALINIHKTRLNDPHLSFLGTNDQPGDYRSSGCTACHVVYANDRDEYHSGPWAKFGNLGETQTPDPTIPRGESGHPIVHRFARAIPTSQCMSCHMHQPNAFLNTYLGYTMWDYVTDAPFLWPEKQKKPTEDEKRLVLERNPEGAAARGLWGDVGFLSKIRELNPKLKHTQFADYHGHGWVFRAVYKQDRAGNLRGSKGELIPFDSADKFEKAVHLQDIHLKKGMHCVDCHFAQDSHGTGLLHGEYGNAIEIRCEDCHGTVRAYTNLRTSGPAAPPGGGDLTRGRTPFDKVRFVWRDEPAGRRLFQRSMLDGNLEWPVVQVKDTVTPGAPEYSPLSARAKTIGRDNKTWGAASGVEPAHAGDKVACYSCHSSWITSCSGCHLPQTANVKSDSQHYEGATTRNFASYNPQVIRTDMFILGRDSSIKGKRIVPVRSSSALVLSSTNANRQRFYVQQPPISAPGYSSQAFNPHFPHTVRATETKTCSDCHVSEANDNNAWLAGLMGLGTNFPNFIGRFAWVGLGEKGLEAVAVTEWDEPQPVIGSYLHRMAFPDNFRRHESGGRELTESHHHHGGGDIRSLQLRGEFLLAAMGKEGFRAFDVANIDNKDFSERIVTAPVSPIGQKTRVDTEDATVVALPTTMPVAAWKRTALDYPQNEDRPMNPIYRYAFVGDRKEGLVAINVDTLTDGIPTNNFLERTPMLGRPAFNPEGALTGTRALTVAGNWIYAGSDRGLVVLDVSKFDGKTSAPEPRVAATLPELTGITGIAVQFRYLFVTSGQGLTTVDITDPAAPKIAARLAMQQARNLYVARTYAYVAAGSQGLVIVNIERPEAPVIDQTFNADGAISDAWDVKVASTSSLLYAYVADGKHGLRVLELTDPDRTPGYLGFSPRPAPRLIATAETHGPAYALSKGLDRDRAVDESGNQVSVFNRIGARPFDLEDMRRLYMQQGAVYRVRDVEAPAASPTGGR
jgi:hypothetical protein